MQPASTHGKVVSVNQFVKITPGDGLRGSLSARIMYYTQRLVTAPFLRNHIANLIARLIRARHDAFTPRTDSIEAQQLKVNGYVPMGELLTAGQCADIQRHLHHKSGSDRFATQGRFTIAKGPDRTRMAEYDLVDIINCPHILSLANDPRVLALAEQYLGCKPTLSSLMLRWSFPADAPIGNVQRFHRDSDDWRHLKIMVYLTDVTASDGPHVYVLGTHKEAAAFRIQVEDDEAIHLRYGRDAVRVVTGARGTGFAVDTAGIHKGETPVDKPRLMLQMQYSLLPVFANQYSPQVLHCPMEFDRYVNRLFVA